MYHYYLKKRFLVKTLTGLAGFILAVCVSADDQQMLTEIVVESGFKKSIKSGIAQEMEADIQMEALGMGDFGSLPGRSVAEVLARMPAVTGIRDKDTGVMENIVVRGATDLTLATLNGREQVTMDHDGSRNVEYNLYPTHVLSDVQVMKTTTAEMNEGGVSGTVNMNTIRPLDYAERRFSANVELNQYAIGDDVPSADTNGSVASFTYVDQLTDNFGVAFGLGIRDESIGRVLTEVGSFDGFAGGGFGGEPPDVDGDGETGDEVIPFGIGVQSDAGSEDTTSVFVGLQYATDQLDVNFDYLASDRERARVSAGTMFQGLNDSGTNGTISDVTYFDIDGIGYVDIATIGVTGQKAPGFGAGAEGFNLFTNLNDRNAETSSTGVNVEWTSGEWILEGDLYRSEASLDYYIDAATAYRFASTPGAQEGFGCPCPASAPNITITTNLVGEAPDWTVAEDLTVPGFYAPRDKSSQYFKNEDSLTGFSLNLEKSVDHQNVTALKFGYRYSDREKNVSNPYNINSTAHLPDNQNALTSEHIMYTVSAEYGPTVAVIDPAAMSSLFSNPENYVAGDTQSGNPVVRYNSPLQNTYDIIEETTAIFAQMDFQGEVSGMQLTGNIGVRYVDTDSESPGYRSRGDRLTTLAEAIDPVPSNSYSEVLPSLNTKLQLSDDSFVRFGYGKVMSRAPLDALRSTEIVTVGGFGVSATGGNPTLDPTVAEQVSLTYGYQPNEDLYLKVGYFYNSLDTYVGETILNSTITLAGTPAVPESIDGFGNVTAAVPAQPESTSDYSRTTQENMEGGYIRGWEFRAYSMLGFISPTLENVGIDANYTVIDSDVRPKTAGGFGGPSELAGLAGLAEAEGKFSVFYDDEKFEARLNIDYRDKILVEGGFGAFMDLDERTLTSFQVSYAFRDDATVSVFGQNVTDEPFRSYRGDNPILTGDYVNFRSVYGVKLNYDLN